MRKRLRVVIASLALCLAFGCVNLAGAQIRTGGYKEISRDNPDVEAAANFAVAEQGRKEETSFTLVSIEHAESQVVAGVNYRLCLKVSTDSDDEPQGVKVVVYRNLKKEYSLTSWEEADCGESNSQENHASLAGLTHQDKYADSSIGPREEARADSITSLYSSLSHCKMVSTGRDSSTRACVGVGGYNLRIEYGDARESITVISPNGKKHPLNFGEVISVGFSSVGEKAEWRVIKKNGKIVPVALIIRFNASENPADSSRVTSYLAVAKITPQGICVTDKIAPGSQANEEARSAADSSAAKPCLKASADNHYAQRGASVAGVYENFTVGKGSGDLEGMRVVIVAAGGGYHAIVQVAQGGAEDPQPEFVEVKVKGLNVEFTAGSQKYTGRVTAAGLTLKDSSGSHLLKRKPCAEYFNMKP